jgi:hypothetical protein
MSWWDEAGAVVDSCDCDHYRDDCPTNRVYGPFREMVPDRTGHKHLRTDMVVSHEHPKGGWPALVCECGWRDFPTNYFDHLATLPKVEAYR